MRFFAYYNQHLVCQLYQFSGNQITQVWLENQASEREEPMRQRINATRDSVFQYAPSCLDFLAGP